ncbi:MAG TPA: response regulator [Arenibacter sp.]|nr:response regulator [Arenibacter sp.]
MLSNLSLKGHKEVLKKEIEINGRLRFQEFLSSGQNNVVALENLKERIEMTHGKYFEYWEEDARLILKQNPSFKFVQWIDSSMIIKKVMPLEGNEAVIDLDISNLNRKEEWMHHIRDSSTNITSWMPLTQGGVSFLVDVPVFFGDRFQGTITAGMDFSVPFNDLASEMKHYAIEMMDDKGTIFYRFNQPDPSSFPAGLVFQDTYEVDELDGQSWTFFLMPKEVDILRERRKEVYSDLVFGILLSLLTSSLIYFYRSSRNENERYKDLNLKLSDANDRLREERIRAEKASKAKTEFVSNMSHEIRTPLNAIIGFIEVLKAAKLDRELMECLSLMDLSSKKLLLLINDILEIDKIESGQIDFRNDVFSPAKEIVNIISIYRPSMEAKGLRLDINLRAREKYYVVGDMGKYGQILTNLIRNALKFTERGGVGIDYTEEVTDHSLHLQISIRDSGIGIPGTKLKTIFERFTQIDSGISKRHEGSGLGLYITYLLIELMEGQIEVKSVENEGTEFLITLKFPLSEVIEKNNQPDPDTIDLSGYKVLIVDDNKINVMVLKKTMDNFGIDSYWVGDGRQAVEAVAANDYDLIFMDIHMPEMDGFEATREIRKTNKEIIIIGFSADVTKETIQDAKDVGMNDYLTKPISFDKLKQNLFNYLVVGFS